MNGSFDQNQSMFSFSNYWAASALALGLLFLDHMFKSPLHHWRFI